MKANRIITAAACMLMGIVVSCMCPGKITASGPADSSAASGKSFVSDTVSYLNKASGSGEIQLIANNESVTPAETRSAAVYQSETTASFATYNYSIVMTGTGVLRTAYSGEYGSAAVSLYDASGAAVSSTGSGKDQDGKDCMYYYCKAGTYRLSFTLTPDAGYQSAILFSVMRLSVNSTIPTDNKTHYCGNLSGNITKFKVKVPASGYLAVTLTDPSGQSEAADIKIKTKGFSDYDLFTKENKTCWLGVKKGTYTFTVNTEAPEYAVKVKYKKITEGSYGKKKSKAVSISRGKSIKGLIITNKKKIHWYKFSLTSPRAVKLTIKSVLAAGGTADGGIKVTVYGKKSNIVKTMLYGSGKSSLVTVLDMNGSKLEKGTYRIRIESYNGGTGYYTVRWK